MARVEGEDGLIEKVIVWGDLFEEDVPAAADPARHLARRAPRRAGARLHHHDGRDPADALAQRAAPTRTDPLEAG